MDNDGTKRVLVQLGNYNRIIRVDSASGHLSEREALISYIRATFSDKIGHEDTITLQMKDENWAGAFVDYFQDTVPDKSVFRAIAENPQVSTCALPGK